MPLYLIKEAHVSAQMLFYKFYKLFLFWAYFLGYLAM